ncbi:hypothetical protein DN404_01120 [Bacillus sp. TE8-1]|nr:hypothetical protein DN404_01120 [Bacillus sp. TE8-1]
MYSFFHAPLRVTFFTLHILHSFKSELYPSGLFRHMAGDLVNYLLFPIKITILFTFLIHLRNIHMLSSVSSFLFIKLCELYRHKKP